MFTYLCFLRAAVRAHTLVCVMCTPSCALNHIRLMILFIYFFCLCHKRFAESERCARCMLLQWTNPHMINDWGSEGEEEEKISCYSTHYSETGTQRGIRRGEQKVTAHGRCGCFRMRPFHTWWFHTISFLLQMKAET